MALPAVRSVAVQNADFAQVYGDLNTAIWIAPKGTTLPEDFSQPTTEFESLGWLDPDAGIVMNVEKEFQEFHALQGATLIKRRCKSVTQKLQFTALEESQLVQELVFINAIEYLGTAGARIAKQDITGNQGANVERAVIIDTVAEASWVRYCLSAVDLSFQGAINLAKNDGIKMFGFDSTILSGAAGYQLTTSPGVMAGDTGP